MNRRGMTLVELTAVTLIAVVAGGAVLQMFLTTSQIHGMLNNQGVLQMELSLATAQFNRDAQLARATTPTWAGFTQDLDSTLDGTATLIFQLYALGASDAPLLGPPPTYDYIIYTYVAATRRLRRIVSPTGGTRQASDRPIATNVTAVLFNNNNAPPLPRGEVSLRLTGSKTQGTATGTLTVESKTALRND